MAENEQQMKDNEHLEYQMQRQRKFSQLSWIKAIYLAICPCFLKKVLVEQKENKASFLNESTDKNMSNKNEHQLNEKDESKNNSTIQRKLPMMKYQMRQTNISLTNKASFIPFTEPFKNKLVLLGDQKGKMICKIQKIRLQPSAAILKRAKRSQQNAKHSDIYYSKLDKFWPHRYQYFQKFEEGIKIDDQSLENLLPEVLSEHIASKIRCEVLLDAFCGIGNHSIKFANRCTKIISNDISQQKLKCLIVNSKIYCVQNIQISNINFLDYKGIKPEVIFMNINNYAKRVSKKEKIHFEDIQKDIKKIVNKSFQITNNIILLLPADVELESIVSQIAQSLCKIIPQANSCSIKIEQIRYKDQTQCLVLYYGTLAQDVIKISDQLSFIYSLFKNDDPAKFQHKRIIRTIREQYGMVNLLSYVYQSRKAKISKINTDQENLYNLFQQFLVTNNLITSSKLQRLKTNQKMEENRVKMAFIHSELQQQKFQNSEFEDLTNSYYSSISDQITNSKRQDSQLSTQKRQLSYSQNDQQIYIQKLNYSQRQVKQEQRQ